MNVSNIWSSVKSNKKEYIYSTWQAIPTNKKVTIEILELKAFDSKILETQKLYKG